MTATCQGAVVKRQPVIDRLWPGAVEALQNSSYGYRQESRLSHCRQDIIYQTACRHLTHCVRSGHDLYTFENNGRCVGNGNQVGLLFR